MAVTLALSNDAKRGELSCSPGVVPGLREVQQDDHLQDEEHARPKVRQPACSFHRSCHVLQCAATASDSTARGDNTARGEAPSRQPLHAAAECTALGALPKAVGAVRAAPATSYISLTVHVDEAVGEEEGQHAEGEPQGQLDHPVAVVQVLVPLVRLVFHAQQRKRHEAEEQL